jgi:HK97 family phage major capsid protein/HK97 family phage prohead protease
MEKRNFEIEKGSIRADTRTIEASLSSEHPVRRFDGEEVLLHTPEAIDLSRAPLPLLRGHDSSGLPIGLVENLRIEDSKLRGTIRLSSNQDEIWKDITDGILRNLSIGYQILEKERTKTGFKAKRWMPYEVSLVSVPADNTVGINRNFNTKTGEKKMDKNDVLKAKKAVMAELDELAKSGANMARMAEISEEIRSFDQRLEAFELIEKEKKSGKDDFKPELHDMQDRQLMTPEGGPAYDRTYAGMFTQGRKLEVNEDEMRAFRASMVSAVPSSGGFSIPAPMAAKWLDDSLPSEIIRPRATVWPMESATRTVVGWDGADQSGGKYFGGFEMEFLAEEGTGNKQTGKLRQIKLSAKKGAVFVDVSNELVEDGLSFEAQLEIAIKKSISLGLDYHFLTGVGGGLPLGVVNSPGVVTVSKEVGQPADTIWWDNVAKMYARMYPGGRSNAIWIANETCLPQLLTGLTVPIGTGGQWVNVFSEKDGKFSILGRPCIFTPNLPVLGDLNDLIFVDLSQYAIGIRKEMKLEKSNIPGWTNDLMSYRVIVRVDGQGAWSDVIKPRKGETLGWCVNLQAR